ncbi:uncharacterized protein LOC120659741 isoform X2 [Panicum virgatum]|uniref:uncharacterized protein LOC120659741 isoform X2 n=1 Tax=Panicum virgatum TaxID=38727 RepID=UPI0019D66754|nr:uncharacterized protein LOC120659741 isoform X2 [Panicum virgatum]
MKKEKRREGRVHGMGGAASVEWVKNRPSRATAISALGAWVDTPTNLLPSDTKAKAHSRWNDVARIEARSAWNASCHPTLRIKSCPTRARVRGYGAAARHGTNGDHPLHCLHSHCYQASRGIANRDSSGGIPEEYLADLAPIKV